jgi:hypothetical protein
MNPKPRLEFRPEAAADTTRHQLSAIRFPQWLAPADAWLERRTDWLIWVVAFVGAYSRIRLAAASYLNADETQIMFPPLQHGLIKVDKAAFHFPYGPLMNYILHFMTAFGGSELYFRMPSVVAGTLLAFVGYKWAGETFGRGVGLVTGSILAFAPSLVIQSAQVRHYITQALFMVCSLYCLERALRERSRRWMRYFAVAMLLAVLTMYMSIWYIVALGAYASLCFVLQKVSRAVIIEWIKAHAIVALVIAAAYVTHLRKLRGNSAEQGARNGWLGPSYFHPESQTLWNYLHSATDNLFGYAFANPTLGSWMIAVFLIGIGVLLWGKAGVPDNRRTPALSLVLPLAVTAAAGSIGIYPYGGSRHDAFLVVFIATGVAIAISAVAGGRTVVLMFLGACLIPVWLATAQRNYLDEPPQVCKIEQMRSALKYLSSRNPRPRVLLVDEIGSSIVDYYVCHGATAKWRRVTPGSNVYRCADYPILTLKEWGAPPTAFPAALAKARAAMPQHFPDPAWVFYVSPFRTEDETRYSDWRGVFGKIEIYRISP